MTGSGMSDQRTAMSDQTSAAVMDGAGHAVSTPLTGRGCQLPGRIRHYEVLSPECEIHPGNPHGWSPEPPEYGRCWGLFEAETAAKAKAMAVQSADFDPWRDCVDNPFKGLSVRLFRCEHGTCMGCVEDPTHCRGCAAEWERESHQNGRPGDPA